MGFASLDGGGAAAGGSGRGGFSGDVFGGVGDIGRALVDAAAQNAVSVPLQNLQVWLHEPAQVAAITPKGSDATTVIDVGECRTYAFAGNTLATFLRLAEACRRDGVGLHFAERQGSAGAPLSGIMVDFDIALSSDSPHLVGLSDRNCHRLASCFVSRLAQDLVFFPAGPDGPGKEETSVHFFFIAPDGVRPGAPSGKGNAFRFGFHVLVPGVLVSRPFKRHFVDRIRSDPRVLSVIRDICSPGSFEGSLDECVDPGSAHVPVHFLGSSKVGRKPYGLRGVYRATVENGPWGCTPVIERVDPSSGDFDLVTETSLGGVAARVPDGTAALVSKRVVPVRPDVALTFPPPAGAAIGPDPLDGVRDEEGDLSTLAVRDPDARFICQLLDLLDSSYARARNKWRDVVYAIANTSASYKLLAVRFSKKCPEKWADGGAAALDQIWTDAVRQRGLRREPITRRSLIDWARASSPERFVEVSSRNYFTVLASYTYRYRGNLEHFMVAEVLYAMLGDKFVVDVAPGDRGHETYTWFEFVMPGQVMAPGEVWKWRRETEPDEIQLYISRVLSKVFDQVAEDIDGKRRAAPDERRSKYYTEVAKAFASSSRRLFNDGFKRLSIRQANYLFRIRNFVSSLDKDPHLIGVGNGVLSLARGPDDPCSLIERYHEFPISAFTETPFVLFDPDDEWVRLLLGAFSDIFPEPDVYEWMLFFAASSLPGGSKEGVLPFLIGGGSNGKTFFMRMIAKALGRSYSKKLAIGLLTSDRESADRPNSAVMQLKGCHFGYCEETEKAEVLKTARIKEIINPGEISGRELNSKQENFEVTANVMLGSNFDFRIETTDHGTWRRLRYYKNKVKFCPHPDPGNPFEKLEDQRFVREYVNSPECRTAMLSILVHYYERLWNEFDGELKRVPCPTIDAETEEYRNSQDAINRFITDMVIVSPSSSARYPLAVVATLYGEWYNTHVDRRRQHIPSEIIQDFENSALAPFVRRALNLRPYITGCRLLTEGDMSIRPGESYFGSRADPADAAAAAAAAVVADTSDASDAAAARLRSDAFDSTTDVGRTCISGSADEAGYCGVGTDAVLPRPAPPPGMFADFAQQFAGAMMFACGTNSPDPCSFARTAAPVALPPRRSCSRPQQRPIERPMTPVYSAPHSTESNPPISSATSVCGRAPATAPASSAPSAAGLAYAPCPGWGENGGTPGEDSGGVGVVCGFAAAVGAPLDVSSGVPSAPSAGSATGYDSVVGFLMRIHG